MATFKVGQRVRVVQCGDTRNELVGREGTVLRTNDDRYEGEPYAVLIDDAPSSAPDLTWSCRAETIAPLTDPLAEKFIETVKTWLKEKEVA